VLVQKYEPGKSARHFAFAPGMPPRFALELAVVTPANCTSVGVEQQAIECCVLQYSLPVPVSVTVEPEEFDVLLVHVEQYDEVSR
jgi:hypothetical protein